MKIKREQEETKKSKRSFPELFTEVLGWLQIVASPLLAGLVSGFLIYLAMPGTLGMILAIAVAFTGLIVGVIWATRIWNKKGTINFMARMIATPELGEESEELDNSTL